MKYLIINGERRSIPPYPHHKEFIYRTYRFFTVQSLFSFLTVDGLWSVPKKFLANRKYGSVIPRLMLIDPTSACNLKCTGCWAADYDKNHRLTFEKLDELITDSIKIGVRQIIFSGGEPLMMKRELLDLCRKHKQITFGAFTNGTLIDEEFADEMATLTNMNVFISIEGFEEDTDFRRGTGTYKKVLKAMQLLKQRDIGFGFSVCYHSKNFEIISSDEFLDFMQECGAWFGWLFNYIPIGSDADPDLCCKADQRAHVMQKIDSYSKRHHYVLIDFANCGHKAIGCVAAGNDFAHINANGDLEPCAFCHYSDANINNLSLLEALQSPFFRKFRNAKPFSSNFLKPCPMMDIPEALVKLTSDSTVRSTHLGFPESGEQLACKTRPVAQQWSEKADLLYETMPEEDKKRFGTLNRLLQFGNKMKIK